MGYFSCVEIMPRLLCLRQQLLKVEMDEDKRLEKDVKLFFWKKNVVVSKLNLAFEVLATAFGVELEAVLWHSVGFMLMLVAMTMHARICRINKTARQVMVFSAIVVLHVPTN